MSAVIIGESLIDVTCRADGTVSETPGGGPFNIAVGVSRLAVSTSLLTSIGTDARGHMLVERLRGDGVNGFFHGVPETSVARAQLDLNGIASYEFDIDGSFELTPEMWRALDSADVVHTGSIAAHYGAGAATVLEAFTTRRGKSLATYDPNCRPSITPDAQIACRQAESFVAASDMVKASDEDMEWLYPGVPIAEVARHWLMLGANLVVVTRGADGLWGITSRGVEVTVSASSTQLVDTIGAGDSAMAALIAGAIQRGAVEERARTVLSSLTADDLRGMLEEAALAAGITCSRAGANPPTAAELGRQLG